MYKIIKISKRLDRYLVALDTGTQVVPWVAYPQKIGDEMQIRFYGGKSSFGYVPCRHPKNDFPFARALLDLILGDETETEIPSQDNEMKYEHYEPSEPDFKADWQAWILKRKTSGGTRGNKSQGI